jgi:hypothetical protein
MVDKGVGVMEYWSNGVMGSEVPAQTLQHSVTPIEILRVFYV